MARAQSLRSLADIGGRDEDPCTIRESYGAVTAASSAATAGKREEGEGQASSSWEEGGGRRSMRTGEGAHRSGGTEEAESPGRAKPMGRSPRSMSFGRGGSDKGR